MDYSQLIKNNRPLHEITDALYDKVGQYPYLFDVIVIVLSFVISLFFVLVFRRFLCYVIHRIFTHFAGINEDVQKNITSMAFNLAQLLPPLLFSWSIYCSNMHLWIAKLGAIFCLIVIVVRLTLAVFHAITLFGLWYIQQSASQNRPIWGFIQTAKFFIGACSAICVISLLTGKSPMFLLTGLGALAAVLMLIFQDALLSFVASIRINTNNLVKIGDWICIPGEDVDGNVKEISLQTVKVENWNMTISMIPVRKLVEGSFINYSNMFENGARQIQRYLSIDQRSIRFLSDEEVNQLQQFDLLNEYITAKKDELKQWNEKIIQGGHSLLNTRRITNIGTFRKYMESFLKHNKNIRQDLTLLVRQLPPKDNGLPLEIYCYCKITSFSEYEQIQSDIFDHLLAILPYFGLRVFQRSSDVFQHTDKQTDMSDSVFKQNIQTNSGQQD